MTSTPETDIVVVGAGLAGLSAAALLARGGHRVTLLELRDRLGGRATTDERDGFLWNQGPHALYAAGAGRHVLRSLGIEPLGASPGTGGSAILNGRIAPAASDLRNLLTTRLLPLGGRLALGRAVSRLGRLESTDFDHVTVDEWIATMVDRSDVARVLHGLVRLTSYGNAPALMSAGAAIAQLQVGLKGVLYLHGGWQQLVDGLKEAALAAGVVVVGGTRVSEVVAGDDRIHVAHGGGTHRAGAVVLAGLSPVVVARLLDLPGDDAQAAAGPAVDAAVLDVALGSAPEHKILIGFDEPLYFSTHGPVADLCPPGTFATVALRYLAPHETHEADATHVQLRAHAALAGATDVLHQRYLHRMTVTHGLPLASRGGLKGRPSVVVSERPGVYLAGDWVGDTGMLADASLASAASAARAAAEHLQQRGALAR